MLKTSAVQASRLRQAWKGVRGSVRAEDGASQAVVAAAPQETSLREVFAWAETAPDVRDACLKHLGIDLSQTVAALGSLFEEDFRAELSSVRVGDRTLKLGEKSNLLQVLRKAKEEMHKEKPARKEAWSKNADASSADESTVDSGEPEAPKAEAPAKPGASKWEKFTVEKWRSAVYINQAYFGDLIADTSEFITTVAENIKLGGKRVSICEVGCGTGEFVRAVAENFRTAVGVDFNPNFIDYCKDQCPKRQQARSHYLQGDATKLYDLMKSEFPFVSSGRGLEFWDDTRIVACVGNTIGIIPEPARTKVYEQMVEVSGQDGVIIMVYWNARWFGDACLNFYHANPQLCGPFDGSCVNLKTTTLCTPSGYRTHWTGVDEARAVMESFGLEIISLREKGKGVFVAARRA